MKDKLNFYIDGSWVKSESKEKIAVINPANEELIGHISSGTKDDINKAVLAASNAFKTYQLTSKEDRIELLNNIISEYENRYDDLVQTITEEMGAPVWLSQKAQASTGIKNLHETLDALKDYHGRIKITLVPNLTNICYGRGVGYKIEEIVLDEKTQQISATKIREQMRKDGKLK